MYFEIMIHRKIDFDIILYSVIFAASLYLSIFVWSSDFLIFAFMNVCLKISLTSISIKFLKSIGPSVWIYNVLKDMFLIYCYERIKIDVLMVGSHVRILFYRADIHFMCFWHLFELDSLKTQLRILPLIQIFIWYILYTLIIEMMIPTKIRLIKGFKQIIFKFILKA